MSDEIDREAVKQAVRAAAWDEGRQCPTCQGDGKTPGGRRLIHCRGGFTGADWDEEAVLAAIDAAEKVKWMPGGSLGHDLAIRETDGTIWRFEVKAPQASETPVR